MPRRPTADIPAAIRKTLLEWIEFDHGDTTSFTQSACCSRARALHARIVVDPSGGTSEDPAPLQPPAGLRLAPLG